MTITQTIDIPADRRITVPREVPTGRTILTFTPDHAATSPKASVERAASPKLRLTKKELEDILQNAETPHTDALSGILAGLGDITVEQIRDERLAKHLR